MSWLQKLLPPKIKRAEGARKSIPEGLWCKCPACEAVLYTTDLESNQSVCPKCGHHHRLRARARLDLLLDPEGRFEIGAEVLPLDPLKFKDSRRYTDRIAAAQADTGETDADGQADYLAYHRDASRQFVEIEMTGTRHTLHGHII